MKDVILPSIIYEQNQQHHLVQIPKTIDNIISVITIEFKEDPVINSEGMCDDEEL